MSEFVRRVDIITVLIERYGFSPHMSYSIVDNIPDAPNNKKKGTNKMEENNNQYYIIRCNLAGVFFARIKERRGDEADLEECRRIWYWSGAASLSQLATEGVKDPSECKFTVIVPEMTVLGVIEIIPCTEIAVQCIKAVPIWKV